AHSNSSRKLCARVAPRQNARKYWPRSQRRSKLTAPPCNPCHRLDSLDRYIDRVFMVRGKLRQHPLWRARPFQMRRPVASGAAKPKIRRENEITRQVIAVLEAVAGDRESHRPGESGGR